MLASTQDICVYLAKKLIYLKALGWISQRSYYPISSSTAVMSLSLLLLLASLLKVLNVDERFSLDWRLVVKDGCSLFKSLSRFLDLPARCDLDFFSFRLSVCASSEYICCHLVACWQQKVVQQFKLSGLWKIQNYGLFYYWAHMNGTNIRCRKIYFSL